MSEKSHSNCARKIIAVSGCYSHVFEIIVIYYYIIVYSVIILSKSILNKFPANKAASTGQLKIRLLQADCVGSLFCTHVIQACNKLVITSL